MIAQLIGELRSDSGSSRFMGQDITGLPVHRRSHLGIARSFQITSIFLNFTALENAMLAVQAHDGHRSEEHTSELQSLMRISYAVFCLKKKKNKKNKLNITNTDTTKHNEHRTNNKYIR